MKLSEPYFIRHKFHMSKYSPSYGLLNRTEKNCLVSPIHIGFYKFEELLRVTQLEFESRIFMAY